MRNLIDFILHVDEHLQAFTSEYGWLTYALLFLIVFCETGLVFMPLLPGDSLLFAAGALAANPDYGLNVWLIAALLMVAAILGDTVNYHIGRWFGLRLPFLSHKHVARTQAFFERHGGKTIILARFLPIIRTFAPFVAGIARMDYSKFLLYNAVGGVVWVMLFLMAGYYFGQHPYVKENFELIVVAIIAISVLPVIYEAARGWFFRRYPGHEK